MNNKKGTYIYDGDTQDVFLQASKTLFDAVSHTLGKDGKNTAIPVANGYLSIINDGKTILESLSSDDMAIKLALNTLKESSFATNLNAGDGTTTTTVIQHLLLQSVVDFNRNSETQITSKDLIEVRDHLLSVLPKYKKTIETPEQLRKVIQVALGGDELVDTVYKAFIDENNNCSFTRPALVRAKDKDTSVVNIDGVSLTPVEVNPVVLRSIPLTQTEKMNVLIINQNISRIDNAFTSLLEKIVKSNRPTILLYTEIMPSVMDQLLYNIQEGSLHLVPIRLAYPITKIQDYIKELSNYFNAKVIDDLYPYQVAYKDPEIFGEAEGYIINKDSAVIKNVNTEYKSELLPAKSALINVGFVTHSQQEEDYRRLEDAVHSAYNALTYGYTIGAGYTLLCLESELNDFNGDIIAVVQKTFNYLFNNISSRFNMDTDEFISYCMNNVYDSYKVTEQVILNAFTVVSQVLSTEKILVPYM